MRITSFRTCAKCVHFIDDNKKKKENETIHIKLSEYLLYWEMRSDFSLYPMSRMKIKVFFLWSIRRKFSYCFLFISNDFSSNTCKIIRWTFLNHDTYSTVITCLSHIFARIVYLFCAFYQNVIDFSPLFLSLSRALRSYFSSLISLHQL